MNKKIHFKWKLVVCALLIIMIFPGSLLVQTSMAVDTPLINYKLYFEDYGWSNNGNNTDKRLESIMIDDEGDGKHVLCSAYIEGDGWTPFEKSGKAIGKISRNMPIKSIKLKLDDMYSTKYSIEYRVCYKNNIWSKWYSNGQMTGTKFLKDIYNLEIRITKK